MPRAGFDSYLRGTSTCPCLALKVDNISIHLSQLEYDNDDDDDLLEDDDGLAPCEVPPVEW